METTYDSIILGAEPVGSVAGLYRGRYRLNILLVEKGQDGGQTAITLGIENYPSQMVEAEKSGATLIVRMIKQVDKSGAHRVSASIGRVELEGPVRRFTDIKGNAHEGKTVIIATGAHPEPIGCRNEKEFLDRGISFCTTCGVNFYEDMEVYVVGGGDSTIKETIHPTKFARKVTVIHRGDQLRTAQSIQEKVLRNEKLHLMWDSVMDEIGGDGILDVVVVRSVKTGELTQVNADPDDGMFGLFGFIGYLPNTGLLGGTGLATEGGYVRTDENMRTNLSGVYAAGDVRVKSLRQVVMVAADGVTAACQAEHYVADPQ